MVTPVMLVEVVVVQKAPVCTEAGNPILVPRNSHTIIFLSISMSPSLFYCFRVESEFDLGGVNFDTLEGDVAPVS